MSESFLVFSRGPVKTKHLNVGPPLSCYESLRRLGFVDLLLVLHGTVSGVGKEGRKGSIVHGIRGGFVACVPLCLTKVLDWDIRTRIRDVVSVTRRGVRLEDVDISAIGFGTELCHGAIRPRRHRRDVPQTGLRRHRTPEASDQR